MSKPQINHCHHCPANCVGQHEFSCGMCVYRRVSTMGGTGVRVLLHPCCRSHCACQSLHDEGHAKPCEKCMARLELDHFRAVGPVLLNRIRSRLTDLETVTEVITTFDLIERQGEALALREVTAWLGELVPGLVTTMESATAGDQPPAAG